MKLSIYFMSVVLLVVFTQSIKAKSVNLQKPNIEEPICQLPGLVISARDLRGVRDVWAKIRNSAIKSWIYIKSVAENTKEKIKLLMENVKEHAKEVKNRFELKLEELKVKLNDAIADLYGTGELAKQCLKKEQQNLKDILKERVWLMSECIAGEINISQLISDETQLPMNETKFMKELDDTMGLCERNKENVQECLCNVTEDIFDNFADMENHILKSQYESRNIAEDIKGTLVSCSLENLIDATSMLSAKILDIAKCVMEAKQETHATE